jgi:ribonuclease HII
LKKKNCGRNIQPRRTEEAALMKKGFRRIAGLDEAGRGALAGPVVAAAVILPELPDFGWFEKVRDSKMLTAEARENIYLLMQDSGIEMGVGIISPDVIDNINILNATKKAMKMALEQLPAPPDYILTDAVNLPGVDIPQKGIIKGDRDVLIIACASVVAKVTRDRIMVELDISYPQYGFCQHKGYGTRQHIECLQQHGASAVHRFTFAPVRELSRLI